MKKCITLLSLVASMAISTSSFAGTSNGKVSRLFTNSASKVFFTAGTHLNPPVCQTGNDWAINASTASGKAMYAELMMAISQGKIVHVVGVGSCVVHNDRETVQYLYVDF